MKTKLIVWMVVVLVVVSGNTAGAVEKLFDLDGGDAVSLRAEVSSSQYWANFEGPMEGSDFSFSYLDATIGTTVFKGRYFIDIYGRKSITDLENIWDNMDQDLDRWEFNLTTGYQLTPSLSVFLGGRYADTDARQYETYGTTIVTSDFQFKTLGATLGLSYGKAIKKFAWNVWAGGTYARADLIYNVSSNNSSPNNVDTERNSFGVALGGKVRFLLSDNLDISLGLDAYHLDFGDVGNDLDISEETLSLRLGLTYTW